MNKSVLIFYSSLILAMSSCGVDEKKEDHEANVYQLEKKDYALGKYVYQDDENIYHIDRQCNYLEYGGSFSLDTKHYGLRLVDTAEFTINAPMTFRVCLNCVSDNEYEHLRRISLRNSALNCSVTDSADKTYIDWKD